MYHGEKLIAVEQIGPDGGWSWTKGKKTIASNDRLQEAKYNDHTGVLGLSQKYNSAFAKGKVEAIRAGYSVVFEVDGYAFVYLIDKDYRIIGDTYQIGNCKQIHSYSNNKTINSITMPFSTTSSNGISNITVNYQTTEVNKPLATT